jgi:hypothetical protein
VSATHVHTYPVDPSLTPKDAWRELCIFGRRLTFTGEPTWANVVCDGEECRLIESDAEQPA